MDCLIFAISTGKSIRGTNQAIFLIEADAASALLGLPLLSQRVAPHDPCLRDADRFRPRRLFFLARRLRFWAGGWFHAQLRRRD